jgi:hypothetical protein
MILNVCSIVEGEGEVAALPVLLRRIHKCVKPDLILNILPPIRAPKNKVIKERQLERAMELAVSKSRPPRVLFILLDADDDLPCIFGPDLLASARKVRSDIPLGVVLANREFESWFLSSLPSLQGCRGLGANLPSIVNAEIIRNAKGQLTKYMIGSRAYSPVLDQAEFAKLFDMQLARQNSDSFDKCWREIERLLNTASYLTDQTEQ